MNNKIKEWIKEYSLSLKSILGLIYDIDGFGRFLYIQPKKDLILDEKLCLKINKDEKKLFDDVDYLLFEFGGQFYYTGKEISDKVQFKPFKYLGKYSHDINLDFTYLGIHGKYELLNGNGEYDKWCQKAKFYGYSKLGICEKNTLAGTMNFQLSCIDNNIKPIIGETIILKVNNEYIDVKVYVLNELGWRNLLKINKILNVDRRENQHVILDELLKYSKGLVLVISDIDWLDIKIIKNLKSNFDEVFFQIDSVIYNNDNIDKRYLLLLKGYIDKFYQDIKPVLINDSYYVDKEDCYLKKVLNNISKTKHGYESSNQYFKSLDDNFEVFSSLFKQDDGRLYDIFEESVDNANWIGDNVNFQIEVGNFKMPKFYIKDLPEEYMKFNNNNDLFYYLIEKGFEDKYKDLPGKKFEEYWDRLQSEIELIEKGGFVDYFLILWDMIRWSRDNDILIGIGRGSAVGSIISQILGITHLDPIKYELIFERFLNEGRLGNKQEEELIWIKTSEGNFSFELDKELTIKRDNQELNIRALDLIEDDQIIKF